MNVWFRFKTTLFALLLSAVLSPGILIAKQISPDDSPFKRSAHTPLIRLAQWIAILGVCSSKHGHSWDNVLQDLKIYASKVKNHYADRDYADKLLSYFSDPTSDVNANLDSIYRSKSSCNDVASSSRTWMANGYPFGGHLAESGPSASDRNSSNPLELNLRNLEMFYVAYFVLNKCNDRFPNEYSASIAKLKEHIDSMHFASDVTDNIWKEAKQKWDQISYTFNYLPDSEAARNCMFFANVYATGNISDVQKP